MRRILAVAILAALATLVGCTSSIHVAAKPNSTNVAGLPVPTVASVPLAGRTQAELDVVSGFATVTITIGSTNDQLLELAGTPGTATPTAILAGDTVAISNAHPANGATASDTARIVLNPNVRWQVALSGGATSAIVDLTGGQVSGVDVTQGVSSLELTTPAQAGTTNLDLAAGVSSLRVHTRGAEPARATLAGGAGNVVIDGVAHSGVAAGSSFASDGWDAAANRVDIECSAGVSSLVVDQT